MTFRELEKRSVNKSSASSPLDEWYSEVRDLPIQQLSDEDICRACRQQLHLAEVLPVALARLRVTPLAGELFDGELASVVARIPKTFWGEHCELRREGEEILRSRVSLFDESVAREINSFLASNTTGGSNC